MKSFLVGGIAALAASAAALADPAGLHETARYTLAGSGETGAVQLDAGAQRLYVARGAALDVLDAGTGAKVGSLALPAGVRGLSLAPNLKRGFATLANNSVAVLDLGSLSVVKTTAAPGAGPAAAAFDPETSRVYVADRDGGDVAVLDAGTGAVSADIALGGKLGGIVCDGFSRVFVTAQDLNVIHVIDSHTLKSLGDYPTAPGVGPTGLAIEDEGRRLFVPCLNGKLVVVDNDIGAVFRILKLEGKGPAVVAFGLAGEDNPVGDPPWKGRIVAVTQDGVVNVGRMMAFVNYVAHDHFSLGARPLGVAVDGERQRAFVLLAASASSSQVVVLDPYSAPSSP